MDAFTFDYALIDGWVIEDRQPFAIETETDKATIFALANGYQGARGVPEMVPARLPGLVGNHISGIYDSPSGDILDREMINLPDWRALRLSVDGAPLALEAAHTFIRRLDLRRGLLTQTIIWRTASGVTLTLNAERFISLVTLTLAAVRWQLEADRDCALTIESLLDLDVSNRFATHHFASSTLKATERGGQAEIITIERRYRVCIAVQHVLSVPAEWEHEQTGSALIHRCHCICRSGEPVVLAKWASVADSRFFGHDPAAVCAQTLDSARNDGYEAARETHSAAWADLWDDSDLIIEGDMQAQGAIRFCLFHLLANAPHSDRVSISARGLQGQDYWGSIFWDCEIYALPFFIYTQPSYARRCLLYRWHTLDGARRKARSLGFDGAYYAWQSQETGDETCALYVFDDPLTGEKLRSYFADEQIHISADIVYALRLYVEAAGDRALIDAHGLEIACEVARFFASRALYDVDSDTYHLRSVLGPDEYHERVDDNAYTNWLAQRAIETALRWLEGVDETNSAGWSWMPSLDERAAWRRLAARFYLPKPDAETKLIEQFTGYFDLEDVTPPIVRARLRHPDQYPGGLSGPYQTTQAIKQADVVLLLYLLRDTFADAVKRANWDYYEPRTAHDSSLSPMAYALMAADLGRVDWAYRYFMQTATMDLVGSGPHWNLGVHTAAMGGAWAVIVRGFCRLELAEAGVWLREWPLLPEGWSRVTFNVQWHGRRVRVETDGRQTTLTALDADVPLSHPGGHLRLDAGRSIVLPHR